MSKAKETPAQQAELIGRHAHSEQQLRGAIVQLKALRRANPDDFDIVKVIAHVRSRQSPQEQMIP